MVTIDMVKDRLDSSINDEALDALLSERYAPPVPEGLAERIIAAIPQQELK